MIRIVGIQFRGAGKVYSFTAENMDLPVGTGVIVETSQGAEYGLVVSAVREEAEENITMELKPVLRRATEEDMKKVSDNAAREKEAYAICNKKIEEHKLDMKLVEVECAFDGSKMLFYFTSDGRVDFRDLVKDLASTFHTRIELRQIGVRDEARTLGGLGICGRPFCCSSFLTEFQPVSIKMAKEQGLSLNPTKISGTCGRLMCCLKYEQEAYEDLIRCTAPIGSYVRTPDGDGFVADYHLLTGIVKVKLDSSADGALRSFKNSDVTLLRRPERHFTKEKKTENTEEKESVAAEVQAEAKPAEAESQAVPAVKQKNFNAEHRKHRNNRRNNNRRNNTLGDKKGETKTTAE